MGWDGTAVVTLGAELCAFGSARMGPGEHLRGSFRFDLHQENTMHALKFVRNLVANCAALLARILIQD
jgi:hypothetical protein